MIRLSASTSATVIRKAAADESATMTASLATGGRMSAPLRQFGASSSSSSNFSSSSAFTSSVSPRMSYFSSPAQSPQSSLRNWNTPNKRSSDSRRGVSVAAVRWINRRSLTTTTVMPMWKSLLSSSLSTSMSATVPLAFLSTATAAYDQTVDEFPSIVIGSNGSIEPKGSFAEVQAQFLEPDAEAVETLGAKLTEANMGVVAHYYMDVELQGVLTAVREVQAKSCDPGRYPRIAIADSLAMGDHAVKMCEDGATAIACLGVDFMSESVRTILTRNGFGNVPVYRLDARSIGCSLAESAERDSYRAWLEKGRGGEGGALHVVYINTSLETKAVSASIVPTITCTSSNVLNTILQASAQMPDLKILYGPDTYMGNNIVTMLDTIISHADGGCDGGGEPWDDARIARDLHPLHNRASLRKLRDNIDVYPHGNCVVHHMFGSEVVNAVRRSYDDAYVTAHLEVPGEMFEIAMERSLVGRGTVGSTSDILKFISKKVAEAAEEGGKDSNADGHKRRLRFILGTEAGMVTSIVKSVRDILERTGNDSIEAEIVFPVSSEAVMGVDENENSSSFSPIDDLKVVPGVAGGEGCSTAGGCATCPFMKMNDLDALNDVVDMVLEGQTLRLAAHYPPNRLEGKTIGGISAVDLGSEPILFMRKLMTDKAVPEELVAKISAGIGA